METDQICDGAGFSVGIVLSQLWLGPLVFLDAACGCGIFQLWASLAPAQQEQGLAPQPGITVAPFQEAEHGKTPGFGAAFMSSQKNRIASCTLPLLIFNFTFNPLPAPCQTPCFSPKQLVYVHGLWSYFSQIMNYTI